jgi:probable rRNA maturation factor
LERVTVFNKQRALRIPTPAVKRALAALMRSYRVCSSEVVVHLVTPKAIGALHAEFLNDPSVTDCLSFPIDAPETAGGVLGEIVVCPQTAVDYVRVHGGDPLRETFLYIIHAFLHLVGFDDRDPKSRRAMRRAERKALLALSL